MYVLTDTVMSLINAGASVRVSAMRHSSGAIQRMAEALHPTAHLTVLNVAKLDRNVLLGIVRAAPSPAQVTIGCD